MQKKNWFIIGGLLLVILAVFVVSQVVSQPATVAPDAPSLTADAATEAATATPTSQLISESPLPDVTTAGIEVTATPTVSEAPTEAAVEAAASAQPEVTAEPDVEGYLVVTVNSVMYRPIPLVAENDYTVNQPKISATNVIHVTRDSVEMKSSTCEGHDCVNQGIITLENKSTRILGNMVICLPNNVTLELYTPDEVRAMLQQMNGTGRAQ